MPREQSSARIVQMMREAVREHQSGRLNEAADGYRKALAIEPRNPDALHLLGLVLHQQGNSAQATQLIEQATMLRPGEALFFTNLGQVYRAMFRSDLAEASLRRAIQIDPKMPEGHANLAAALRAQRKLDEAETSARLAMQLKPDLADPYMTLGSIFSDRGQPELALPLYAQAMQLGSPRHEILNNIGDALRALGRLPEARAMFEQAIRLCPNMALLHWNASLVYLTEGDLPRGFAEYEWRLKVPGVAANHFKQPLWDGGDLSGKTILLHGEQGYGDEIQFVRYAPMVAKMGARVLLQCQSKTLHLLKTVEGIEQAYAHGSEIPQFDFHAPLFSLPHLFGTTFQTIPAKVPYLRADPQRAKQWRQRIESQRRIMNVGLVGAGNPMHINDRNRSISPTELAPLAQAKDVRWFNLQFGSAGQQQIPSDLHLTDFTAEIADLFDSAALIEALDLIISVDTAPAHLAGALGKPVWLLLPQVADWRWFLEHQDSPWYPTMRLFRQRTRGDWQEVLERVVEALADERK